MGSQYGQKNNRFLGHGNHRINAVAFSPTDGVLASASDDRTVKLWHVDTGKIIHALTHSLRVNTIAFSPNGSKLISGSDNGVNAVAFSPGGSVFASGSRKGEVFFWETKRCQKLNRRKLQHSNSVKALAFSPDGKILAVGGDDKIIKLHVVENYIKTSF